MKYILFIIFSIILMAILLGCDTITTKDRLIYEDGSRASGVKIILSNEFYKGTTFTDNMGVFTFIAPADTEVRLCAYPEVWNYEEICYNGYLYTPAINGELISIER